MFPAGQQATSTQTGYVGLLQQPSAQGTKVLVSESVKSTGGSFTYHLDTLLQVQHLLGRVENLARKGRSQTSLM